MRVFVVGFHVCKICPQTKVWIPALVGICGSHDHQMGLVLEMANRIVIASCSIMHLPALQSQHRTTAPTGHSTSAATQKPMKANIGPTFLQ